MNFPPAEVRVGDLCLAQGWRLAVAESCTGGLLGGRITAVPGSSRYFVGGVVAYANSIKTSLLGVPEPMLASQGAVSEPVALAMAEGVLRATGAEAAIAVTGVAGPGGSGSKPAGTVFVAVATPACGRLCVKLSLPGNRQAVRDAAVDAALRLFLDANTSTC